ncbi:hypothetical protein SBADM41S_06617 [Streptomyces badius]
MTRIALDPFVRDLDGESAALRAAGPLAEVELPGGVHVYAVTRHAEARALLTDSRWSRTSTSGTPGGGARYPWTGR